jgi:AraC-like DNA-binding protein
MAASSKIWRGRARMGAGLALFAGAAGDNHPHRHLAHQLCLPAPGTGCRVETELGAWLGGACCIPGGLPHRLLDFEGLLLWVDPTHALARTLPLGAGPQPLVSPCTERLQALQKDLDLSRLFPSTAPQAAALEPRLERVMQCLQQGLRTQDMPDRGALARLCGLSPDRFSHWFRESTGLPLRSYRKWLRLMAALQAVLAGHPLADAAQWAGFADQAHMARTLRENLGVNAGIALRDLK